MRKIVSLLCLVLLSGCTNSPAHRIAVCEQAGGTEADCNAQEFTWEKEHPLPQINASDVDTRLAIQQAFDQSAVRKVSKK